MTDAAAILRARDRHAVLRRFVRLARGRWEAAAFLVGESEHETQSSLAGELGISRQAVSLQVDKLRPEIARLLSDDLVTD